MPPSSPQSTWARGSRDDLEPAVQLGQLIRADSQLRGGPGLLQIQLHPLMLPVKPYCSTSRSWVPPNTRPTPARQRPEQRHAEQLTNDAQTVLTSARSPALSLIL
jgi:hypothetical protein